MPDDEFLWKPKEECGILGIAATVPVASSLFYGLRIVQHRGQESAGIAVYQGGVKAKRGMGLVHEVFTQEDLQNMTGKVGIGHVRYSTTGTSVLENAQPIVVSTQSGDLALGHNGDIANAGQLREQLQRKGWAFMTTSDSEVIVRLVANELAASGDIARALREVAGKLVGAYSLVLLVNDRLFAIRDPLAIRPLCLGQLDEGGHIVSSESVVFDVLGAKFLRDLKPGEVLEVTPTEVFSHRLPHPQNTAHCMFEWVYFARPDSVIDERLAFDVRTRIGEALAGEHPVQADIVVPVPESGRAQAQGFARVSGLPVVEGLIKNRYIERTFIMPQQSDREVGVLLKLNPIRSAIKGRRVVLVDDSIVRGTTIRKIVRILREAGAKEVHVRIGCPPIRAPCYFGIDMKGREQFVANGRTVEEVREFITADTLGYVSLEGLVKAIDHDAKDLCLGCLTGTYPMEIPGERFRGLETLEAFTQEGGPKPLPADEHVLRAAADAHLVGDRPGEGGVVHSRGHGREVRHPSAGGDVEPQDP